jgi:hypothetical protein
MAGHDEFGSDPERRGDARRVVCLAAGVQPLGDTEQFAMIRDVSVHGAFLLTRLDVTVGERLDLRIHFPGEPTVRIAKVPAEVVRIEGLDVARADVWTCGVAVQFRRPLEEFKREIEELAAQARQSGLTG